MVRAGGGRSNDQIAANDDALAAEVRAMTDAELRQVIVSSLLAELSWAEVEVERLHREVARRDAVLDWLAANNPAALQLCPYKAVRDA